LLSNMQAFGHDATSTYRPRKIRSLEVGDITQVSWQVSELSATMLYTRLRVTAP